MAFTMASRPAPSRPAPVSRAAAPVPRQKVGDYTGTRRESGGGSQANTSQQAFFHTTNRLMATPKDPYAILGVPRTATQAEIKKAYYGLAKKYHPDTNKDPGAKDKFAEIQSAYEILSDPEKRKQFDQFGPAAFDPSAGPGPGPGGAGGEHPFSGFGGPFSGFGFGGFGRGFGADMGFEDVFTAFTGRRGPMRGTQFMRGDDIEVQVTISFMEAAKGTTKTINIMPLVSCHTCSGSGLRPGTKRTTCRACGGTGERFVDAGPISFGSTCGSCNGTGFSVPRSSECRTCGGDGVVRERKSITVDIPAGVEDNMRLSINGEGDYPATGRAATEDVHATPGNLHVRVRVARDNTFSRQGADILYTATIPLTTAILGGEVTIPTLDGEARVRVPGGTNTGDKMTLAGMGMPKLGTRLGRHGDLRVEFRVAMPKYLSSNARALVEMLADEMGDKTAKRIMGIGKSS